MGILEARARQLANLQKANQDKQDYPELQNNMNQQYDFSNQEALQGILGRGFSGFANTVRGIANAGINLADKAYSNDSQWAIAASLDDNQQQIVNKLSKQRQIENNLKQLQQSLDPNKVNTEQLVQGQALMGQLQNELNQHQLTAEEEVIRNTPTRVGNVRSHIDPLAYAAYKAGLLGTDYNNLDEIVDAVTQSNERIQERDAEHRKNDWSSNTQQEYDAGKRDLDYSKLNDAPNMLNALNTGLSNLDAGGVAEAIGSSAAFFVPYIGVPMLVGDAYRVYDEGENAKTRESGNAILTASERVKSGAAAAAYGLLNKAGINAITGKSGVIKALTGSGIGSTLGNRAATVLGAGVIEGGTEGAQTVAEELAQGHSVSSIDADTIADSAIKGFASGGLIGGAYQAGGAVKDISEAGKEIKSNISPKNDDEFEKNLEKTTTYKTSNGQINPKFSPAEAIEKTQKYYQNKKDDSPEIRKEFKEQVNNIINNVQVQKTNIDNQIAILESGHIEELERILGEDPSNEEVKEELNTYKELLGEESLDTLKQHQKYLQESLEIAEVTKASLFKEQAIEKKENPTANDILESPVHYTIGEISKAIESTTDEAIKTKLRKLFDYKVEQNRLKNLKDVKDQIINGDLEEGYVGLNQYQNILDDAIDSGDISIARRFENKLANFHESHLNKADAVEEAIKNVPDGQELIVSREADTNNWNVQSVSDFNRSNNIKSTKVTKDTQNLIKQVGALRVHKGTANLSTTIRKEANAIGETLNHYQNTLNNFSDLTSKPVKQKESIEPTIEDLEANKDVLTRSVKSVAKTKANNQSNVKDFITKETKETPVNYNVVTGNTFANRLKTTLNNTQPNAAIAFGLSNNDNTNKSKNHIENQVRKAFHGKDNKLARGKQYSEDDSVFYAVTNATGKNFDNFYGFNKEFSNTSNLAPVAKQRIEELKAAVNAGATIVMHNNQAKYKSPHQVAAEKYLLSNGYQLKKVSNKQDASLTFVQDDFNSKDYFENPAKHLNHTGVEAPQKASKEVKKEKPSRDTKEQYKAPEQLSRASNKNTYNSLIELEDALSDINDIEEVKQLFRDNYKKFVQEIYDKDFNFNANKFPQEIIEALDDATIAIKKSVENNNKEIKPIKDVKENNQSNSSAQIKTSNKKSTVTYDNHELNILPEEDSSEFSDNREDTKINKLYEYSKKRDQLLNTNLNVFRSIIQPINSKLIKTYTGIDINDSQKRQLSSFIKLHNFIKNALEGTESSKGFLENIQKAENWKLQDFIKDNKFSDENIITAITAAIYTQIQTFGLKTKLSSKDIGRLLFNDDKHQLNSAIYKLYGNAGFNRDAVIQEIGDKVLSYLGISSTEQATLADKKQLSVGFGIAAFTALQQSTARYDSMFTKAVPIENLDRLKTLGTVMSQEELIKEIDKYYTGTESIKYLKSFTKPELIKWLQNEATKDMFKGANYYTRPNFFLNNKGEVEGSPLSMEVIKSAQEVEGQDIISLLFEGEYSTVNPSYKPFTELQQKTIKNRISTLPEMLRVRLENSMGHSWSVKEGLFNTLNNLYENNKEQLYSLLGLHSEKELDQLHPAQREQIEAEEQYYKDSLKQKFNWIKETGSKKFYLNPVVWVNHRVGYSSYVMNPQANILDRALVHMDSWKTTVDTNEEPRTNNITNKHGHYLLGLAEFMEGASKSFGFKSMGYGDAAQTVDKVEEADFLPAFQEYINSIRPQIKVAQRLFDNKKLTNDEVSLLTSLIKEWDMGELSLTALYEVSKYIKALDNKTSFETHIGRSSDGVTSGSLTGQILYGAADAVFMERGGYFTDETKSLQETKKKGVQDYYESIAENELNNFIPYTASPAINAVNEVLKQWKATYGTRKSAKVSANPFNYGSGLIAIANAVANASVSALESTYYGLYSLTGADRKEAVKTFNKQIKELINAYNVLNDPDNPFAILLAHNSFYLGRDKFIDLSQEINNLKKEELLETIKTLIAERYEGDYTKAVNNFIRFNKNKKLDSKDYLITEESLENDLDYKLVNIVSELAAKTRGINSANSIKQLSKTYIENRNQAVQAHNLAFKLYEKLFNKILNGRSITDLTKKEKKEIQKVIKDYLPITRSALNTDSEDILSGLFLSKDTSTFERSEEQKVKVNFRDYTDTLTNINTGFKYVTDGDIGVGGLALQVQSGDSRVSSAAYGEFAALNAHDSNTTGLDDYVAMVKRQNEEHWKVTSEYSAAYEAMQAMIKPLKGLIELYRNDNQTEDLLEELINIGIYKFDEKSGISFVPSNLLGAAIDIETSKKDALMEVKTVHQYAGADNAGAYAVTESDKKDLENHTNKIVNKLVKEIELLNAIRTDIEGINSEILEKIYKGNKDISPVMNDILSSNKKRKEYYSGYINLQAKLQNALVSKENSTSKFIEAIKTAVLFHNKEDKESALADFINGFNTFNVVYVPVNRRIKNKPAKFIPSTNTLEVYDAGMVDSMVMETVKALIREKFSQYKTGAVNNKEIGKTLAGLNAIANNFNNFVNDALSNKAITEKDVNYLSSVGLKGKLSFESMMAIAITNQHAATILDKIKIPQSKETLLGKIINFVSKLLNIKTTDTLKNVIMRNTNDIINKAQNANNPDAKVESINLPEQSIASVNYFTTGIYNRLANAVRSNKTKSIPVQTALEEIRAYIKDFGDKYAPMEKALLPILNVLEQSIGQSNRLFILSKPKDFPSDMSSEQVLDKLENGTAFTKNNNVYLINPLSTDIANTRATTVVHELLHALTQPTVDRIIKESFKQGTEDLKAKASPIAKLYKELKPQMLNSSNPEIKYTATNLHEFIANILSNRAIQTELAQLMAIEGKVRQTISDKELDNLYTTMQDSLLKDLEEGALKNFFTAFSKVVSLSSTQQKEADINYLNELYKLDPVKTEKILSTLKMESIPKLIEAIQDGSFSLKQIKPDMWTELYESINIYALKEEQVKQQILESPVHSDDKAIYSPKEIYNTLNQGNNNPRLESVINQIVQPLISNIDQTLITGKSAGEVWINALNNGTAVYSSNALEAGFNLSEAETFALETTESALSNILDEIVDTPAYRKLKQAYNNAKQRLSVEDFADDYHNATPEEQEIAQKKYDYLFSHGLSSNEKSDYLIKFISLGLASEEMANILNFVPEFGQDNRGLFEQSVDLFKNINDWIFDRDVSYKKTDTVNERLNNLSIQLANIYLKNRDNAGEMKTVFDRLADNLDSIQDKSTAILKDAVLGLSSSGMFKKTKLASITEKLIKTKLAGSSKVFNFNIDEFKPNQKLGEIRQIANELLGFDSSDEHLKVKDLFAVTKILEGKKQDAFGDTKEFVSKGIFGENLPTKEQSRAITFGVLRTDLQSLISHYGDEVAVDMLLNKKERQKAIKDLERELGSEEHGNEYLIRSKMLADYMIHRKVRNEMLAKNAYAIASRVGLIKAPVQPSKELIGKIDRITSLYAIERLKPTDIEHLKALNNNNKALSAISIIHSVTAKESAKGFSKNPYSYQKGFIPNKTNPFRDVIAVPKDEIDTYLNDGYKEIGNLTKSSYDNDSQERVLMYIPNNGQQRYVSGAFSLQDSHKSGTVVFDSFSKNLQGINKRISNDFIRLVNTISYQDYEKEVGSKNNEALIQSYNTNGDIISHSYEMTGATMDAYLQRVDAYDELMGQLAAQARGASLFPRQNQALVDYAIEEYKNRDELTSSKFVTVSPHSKDRKLRELWHSLPTDTQNYIVEKTGAEALQVKNDVLTMLFGYKKYSPFDHINKPEHLKNQYEKFLSSMLSTWLGKKVKVGGAYTLAAWQEAVKLLKDFVVIRGISVFVGNILSNTAFLLFNRFDPIHGAKDINTALKYSLEFQKANKELAHLDMRIKVEGVTKELAAHRTEVKDSIARNPLKDFIQAGMMPTIVNDVNLVENDSLFKTEIQEKYLDKVDKFIPSGLKTIVDTMLVSKNTDLHNFMVNATQQSDFVFRYAMFKQEIRKGKTQKEAMRIAKDTFIDYDIPTSKGMQFLNDMGLWMYTKFFMRIQRVIMRNLREKPLGVAAEHVFTSQILGLPSILSLSLGYRLFNGWNPFTMPLDDIITMHENAFPIHLMDKAF